MRADEKQVGGDHYKGMAVQPSEYIYRNKLGWYEGNAVKYITRHGVKGGRKDIEKAIHYLELLLEAEYGTTQIEAVPVCTKCYASPCGCNSYPRWWTGYSERCLCTPCREVRSRREARPTRSQVKRSTSTGDTKK